MRYIRTKDGRILKVFEDNVGFFDMNDGLTYYGENTIDFETSCWLPKTEIIKQADTIEELCDEFVVVGWKEKEKPILCKYHKDKNALYYIDENGLNILYIPDLLKNKVEIYGAIWTDKGLKYVAKMNDKGELELL